MLPFKSLHSDSITLHLISEDNFDAVCTMFSSHPDSDYMLSELRENYAPQYEEGKRKQYGFYAVEHDQLAGLSLLSIDDFKHAIGSTGADTLMHMRGKGIAPRSKPHLFYLGFEILQLHRIETGCLTSNIASRRSIEKTPGFVFEGTLRESGLNDQGEFEDQYLYSILRQDWERLYTNTRVSVIE